MKLLVIVIVAMCLAKIEAATEADSKTKTAPNTGNSISQPQKMEVYYSAPPVNQQTQPQQHVVPIQIIPRPVYVTQQHQQQQPHAMFIIAQPTYVPQNQIYYVNPVNHLLNYFHSNPQARYQLLYGGYPQQPQQLLPQQQQPLQLVPQQQPTQQTYYLNQQQQASAPTVAYQLITNPANNGYNQLIPYQEHNNYHQQQYAHPYGHLSIPIRSTPPLITGFENFTPEQQAQIKSHLGAHLGPAITTAATIPSNTVATQPTPQALNSQEYMKERKVLQPSGTAFAPSLVYRTQFTKG